jgi:hypothetical protein
MAQPRQCINFRAVPCFATDSVIKNLADPERQKLLGLLPPDGRGDRTLLAWLRDWPEAPARKNLLQVIERIALVRGLGIEADRERRIHQARYVAISREAQILSAQHFSRLDETRRLATLVIFAREMEVILIDAAITMFDRLIGRIAQRAELEIARHYRLKDGGVALAPPVEFPGIHTITQNLTHGRFMNRAAAC